MTIISLYLTFTVLCAMLIAAAVVDIKTGQIPNQITLTGMALGIALHMFSGYADHGAAGIGAGAASATIGLFAALVPFAIVFFIGGLGGGDVKLFAALGAMLADVNALLAAVLYTFIAAVALAVITMVKRKVVKQTLLRVYRAMFASAFRVDPAMPTDGPKVPFALAIAIGGITAGKLQLLETAHSGL